jgi:protein-L-isoaspartate(D-aspartate) O-methyltransferase
MKSGVYFQLWPHLLFFSILLSPGFFSPCMSAEEGSFAAKRKAMVENDLRGRGIKDTKVLDAMGKIPRHLFVGESQRKRAYEDYPLPIGDGQTISQPYIVALMTEALRLRTSDRVLEIGTGSGYQAAVLAEIAKEIFTIEIKRFLADGARTTLKELGYRNVEVKSGDGYLGWEEKAPFDAVIITAAPDHIPPRLIVQLKEGGRIVLPLGSAGSYQTLTLVTKEKGKLHVEQIASVVFVPMTGEAEKRREGKP